jgi:isopentenyldiphosphate isomerase
MEELFPLVTLEGKWMGRATRTECHSGSFLLHPVVHLHIFNAAGQLYLQKRSLDKDIQPGLWDTSVGGHVDWKEVAEAGPTDNWVLTALMREAFEELGLIEFHPVFAFRYPFRSNIEFELVHTFYTIYEGTFTPDLSEISEARFWDKSEILTNLGRGFFTANFEEEILRIFDSV